MIADTIRVILSNLSVVFCAAALVGGAIFGRSKSWPERYLSWVLLLAVGADAIWAGFFHVFFPEVASQQIGWQPSPFEFEVGIADISLGVVAVIAFWRGLEFKTAIAIYAILFYAGVSVGHVIQAFGHDDFAPDNFGLLLILTVARALVLAWLLICCRQSSGEASPRKGLLA